MNATLHKFDYPESLIKEYRDWVILLRPQQVTLGALILGYKGDETAFSSVPLCAMQELHEVIGAIERTLRAAFKFNKINYLMLMMVDPHVHFHVIPRYSQTVNYEEQIFTDPGWPAAPDLSNDNALTTEVQANLIHYLQKIWKPGDVS